MSASSTTRRRALTELPSHPRRRAAPAPRTARLVAVVFSTAIAAATARAASAQAPVLVQGVADAELWKTDSGSVLLTRNYGRPGPLGRVHLWGAAELGSRVVVYASGTAEGGKARSEPGAEWYTDMAAVRYTHSRALVIDAGKMAHVVGAFASRRYSVRNPLIGAPDGYPVQYPLSLQVSGAHGRVDYRAAVVSLPVYHEDYVPDPTPTPRPAIGGGVTITTGMRVGASATWGPYLNHDLPGSLLAGRSWRAYSQQVGAVDVELSRGYLELRGELAAVRYEVPGQSGSQADIVKGLTYYAEAKYTLTPRFFVASRLERNNYAYIEPISNAAWVASPTDMYNGEIGAGYRLGPQTHLKASVRADRWQVAPALRATLPNGAAFAVQVSRTFDVFEAAHRARR